MIVGYGRTLPDGHLPVFSVGTEAEAQRLLVLSCATNNSGQFIARELAREQTLENLSAFGERLNRAHEILKKNGQCQCKPVTKKGKTNGLHKRN